MSPDLEPPADLVAGLQSPGVAFVQAVCSELDNFSASDRRLLRMAAQVLDEAETTTGRARQSAMKEFRRLVAQLERER